MILELVLRIIADKPFAAVIECGLFPCTSHLLPSLSLPPLCAAARPADTSAFAMPAGPERDRLVAGLEQANKEAQRQAQVGERALWTGVAQSAA